MTQQSISAYILHTTGREPYVVFVTRTSVSNATGPRFRPGECAVTTWACDLAGDHKDVVGDTSTEDARGDSEDGCTGSRCACVCERRAPECVDRTGDIISAGGANETSMLCCVANPGNHIGKRRHDSAQTIRSSSSRNSSSGNNSNSSIMSSSMPVQKKNSRQRGERWNRA
jgi:hypothetical protein